MDAAARLAKAARELVESIAFDEHGTMIGGSWRGGNGGLISKETITKADAVRRALTALEEENGQSGCH